MTYVPGHSWGTPNSTPTAIPPHAQLITSLNCHLQRLLMSRDWWWGLPHAFTFKECHNLSNKNECSKLFYNKSGNTIYILSTQKYPTKITNFSFYYILKTFLKAIRQRMGSRSRRFKFQLCHLLIFYPWPSYLTLRS